MSAWGCFRFDPVGRRTLAKLAPKKPAPRGTSPVSIDAIRGQIGALEGKGDHFSQRERERLTRELERRGVG